MRVTAVAAILSLLSAAAPAAAQDRVPVERRVDSLEKQMRSVQRRVFAPGAAIPQADPPAVAAPVSNAGSVAELTQRIDALERSLADLTGQVEENANSARALDARLDRLEATSTPVAQPAPAPAPASLEPEAPAPAPAAAAATAAEYDPPSTDPAENAYLAGYRLWEAKRYDEAASTLQPIAKTYAKHRRASWARNLLGRAYLDDNKPATAAEAFLSNYQELPQGERAADSLYFLGAALMKLNKPEQACKVYDELGDVYGGTMRDYLKQNLPTARKQAKCRG